jgi:pilus assembly protein CpaB
MRRRWVIPVVSAVLALITTVVVVRYLQTVRQQVTVVQLVKTEAVVFARTSIVQRQVIGADAIEIRQIPAAAVHPQAARRIEDVAGRVATAPIFADEQVLSVKLAPAGVNAGLSYVLPKDKRAMTIGVNEVVGVAGFVFPGDRVDIVATVNANNINLTKIVLQDVEVVAIAQKVDQKPGEEPRVTTSATLALTPEQTEVLAQIDNNGRVRLALRPSGVRARVQTTGQTVEAALGRVPAIVAAAPASSVRAAARPQPRRVTAAVVIAPPPIRAPAVYSVDLWRATERTTVRFEEPRR